MFNLTTESMLEKMSLNEYKSGQEYYNDRRIKSVQFNQSRRTFTATVFGTRLSLCYPLISTVRCFP
jgi:hypothetical protein